MSLAFRTWFRTVGGEITMPIYVAIPTFRGGLEPLAYGGNYIYGGDVEDVYVLQSKMGAYTSTLEDPALTEPLSFAPSLHVQWSSLWPPIPSLFSLISHLIFADDVLLFGHGSVQEAQLFLRVLDMYFRASGQLVNVINKSRIVFDKSVVTQTRTSICTLLHIRESGNHGKYLGAMVDLGKSRKFLIEAIEESINSKIEGWAEKLLSQAEKSILIKSATLATPIYEMSCLKINKGFCKKIGGKIIQIAKEKSGVRGTS
ncbi:hypothetical protein Syun_024831 [Stephania yunnanensis]|uniref:Reverse transcriptase domain-containing protein n=1 Tax=Stephania yunnanensis TaxID=152371 RepID=A0AAP0HV70_9MAGN